MLTSGASIELLTGWSFFARLNQPIWDALGVVRIVLLRAGCPHRDCGYAISQRILKRIEEVFGWATTVGNVRRTRHRGTARVGWMFTFVTAAYTLVRLPKLLAQG